LCDELRRDEDPSYVEADLRDGILGFTDASDFQGLRVLDFGCGSGASTIILSRLLHGASITGVDFDESSLGLASARARHYGICNVSFVCSSHPGSIPADLGLLDAVVLSAVYEHLLPNERASILSSLWSILRPGGRLFINQLPHRWFPFELHTTDLPFINYLPNRAALYVARRFSKHVRHDETWIELLRAGIRGATRAEILSILRHAAPNEPVLIPRRRRGISQFASRSGGSLRSLAKGLAVSLFSLLGCFAGEPLVPVIVLAIEKRAPLQKDSNINSRRGG
jgi:2-polyprenyl-3-methyl-5-hydroxy-6-metoxy-1,4-benzoquinol methylase